MKFEWEPPKIPFVYFVSFVVPHPTVPVSSGAPLTPPNSAPCREHPPWLARSPDTIFRPYSIPRSSSVWEQTCGRPCASVEDYGLRKWIIIVIPSRRSRKQISSDGETSFNSPAKLARSVVGQVVIRSLRRCRSP